MSDRPADGSSASVYSLYGRPWRSSRSNSRERDEETLAPSGTAPRAVVDERRRAPTSAEPARKTTQAAAVLVLSDDM